MKMIEHVSVGTVRERERELCFKEIKKNKIKIEIKDSNKSL